MSLEADYAIKDQLVVENVEGQLRDAVFSDDVYGEQTYSYEWLAYRITGYISPCNNSAFDLRKPQLKHPPERRHTHQNRLMLWTFSFCA